jgi:hypothetical protein
MFHWVTDSRCGLLLLVEVILGNDVILLDFGEWFACIWREVNIFLSNMSHFDFRFRILWNYLRRRMLWPLRGKLTGNVKRTQKFIWNVWGNSRFANIGVNGRIVLRLIFDNLSVKEWTGLNWLRPSHDMTWLVNMIVVVRGARKWWTSCWAVQFHGVWDYVARVGCGW